MMKMRNFFNPFLALSTEKFEEVAVKVGVTVFEQNRKRVFLVTTKDDRVLGSTLLRNNYVAFSSAYRQGQPCLVMETSAKKADAKIIQARTHISIRASDCVFLPVEKHDKLERYGYLTKIGSNDEILVIPFPKGYRFERIAANIEKSAPQPIVENWPQFG